MTLKPTEWLRIILCFTWLSSTLLSASKGNEIFTKYKFQSPLFLSPIFHSAFISNSKVQIKIKPERSVIQQANHRHQIYSVPNASKEQENIYANDQNLSPNRKQAIRCRGRIAYDGTSFGGWQYQPNLRTIQGELEKVLSRRFNRTIRVVGAGRTDAGVHARGQAFHFDLHSMESMQSLQNITNISSTHNEKIMETLNLEELQHSINSMISKDVRVWDLSFAPSSIIKIEGKEDTLYSWHAIASSIKKIYSYRIYVGAAMDPMQRYTRAHIHDPDFDIRKLEMILKHFEGTHDFRAFSAAIEQNARKQGKTAENTDTIRTVHSVSLVRESSTHHSDDHSILRSGDGNYRIDVTLNGALYKMVRNMMGTAFDVCRGKLNESVFLDLLEQRLPIENDSKIRYFDRDSNPSKPAPPEGLCLTHLYIFNSTINVLSKDIIS